jgi:hypothetical protein
VSISDSAFPRSLQRLKPSSNENADNWLAVTGFLTLWAMSVEDGVQRIMLEFAQS